MLTNLCIISILGIVQLIPNAVTVRVADRRQGKVFYRYQAERRNQPLPQYEKLSPDTDDCDTLFNDDGRPWYSFGTSEIWWWAQKFSPGVPCTLKKVLIITGGVPGETKESGELYIWRDYYGVPDEIIAGPIEFQGGSYPNWEEVEIPDIVIAEDFWVGFWTPYPPLPSTDRRYDHPRRIAFSRDGSYWGIAEYFLWGDLMIRVVCVLTGERHDVALWKILPSSGPLLPIGADVTISAIVQNLGNVREDSCPISYTVYTQDGDPVISDTVLVSLSARQIDTVPFERRWHTSVTGEYRIAAENLLLSDVVPENDYRVIKSFVHTYPSTLRYDDGSLELTWSLGVDSVGRFAMKFTPPYYPCKIESIKLYLLEEQPAIGLIIDDDGANGEPGSILAAGEITASKEGWYTIDLSPQNVVIDSGSFYAAYQNPPGEECIFTGDLDEPRTGLDWTFYDYLWFPEEGYCEFGIRVCVNYPVGISEAGNKKKSQFKILANPAKTHTRFLIPLNGKTILTVYNLYGEVCRKWVFEGSGLTEMSWNLCDEKGRMLPSGVYFVNLTSKSDNIREKIILLRSRGRERSDR